MKKIIYIIFILIFNIASGQDVGSKGIHFRDITFEQALMASKQEGKPVFLHGFASWCHFCIFMAESVYPDSTVGAFYNEHFICIKSDLEKEGAELNKQIHASTFPTLVFYDGNGEMIHRAVGRHYPSTFIELGKAALDPGRQLRTWIKNFNDGNASADTTYKVMRMLDYAGMNTQPPLLQYLSRLKPEDISKPENWKIIKEYFKDVDASFIQLLIKRKPELEKLYTTKVVNNKFLEMYAFELFMRNRLLDSVGYDALKQKIKASKLDVGSMICDYADLNRLKALSKYNEYFEAAPPFVKNYCMDDAALLNEISKVYYERTVDSHQLEVAIKWMKRSVELEDSYDNNVLLGNLLAQQGIKADAKTVADHALKIAELNGMNNRSALLLIDKINQME